MTEHERLIELLNNGINTVDDNFGMPNTTQLADYLLDHGVVVPPCKVGDVVHFVCRDNTIERATVRGIYESDYGVRVHCLNFFGNISFDVTDIGKTVFLTYEEAKRALKARENDA